MADNPSNGITPIVFPDRWHPIRRLGKGGHGEVWLCEDLVLGELIAMKVLGTDLTEQEKERFKREASIGRTLRHPRLIEMYEVAEIGERLGLAMEWLPGGTLADRLALGALPVEEALRCAQDALDGLAFLHSKGIIHRDIKPSNLLFNTEGHIKLGDLGLARPAVKGVTITREASAVGTPAYMSPEQLRNAQLTPAADLYALGVTLYEALTGRLPVDERTGTGVVDARRAARPSSLGGLRPDCPRWLRRFVHRLLEKHPRDRFRHAGQAAAALQARQWSPKPRTLRFLTSALAGVLVIGSVIAFTLHELTTADRVAVSLRHEGSHLQAINASGAVAWQRSFSSPVQHAFLADLDGDGDQELLAAAFPRSRRREYPPVRSEVVVLGSHGQLLTSMEPEGLIRPWEHPSPELFMPWLEVVDLDADGRQEVLVTLIHRDTLPCALVMYLPESDMWLPLATNEGYIHEVVVVPGSDPPKIRLRGYNNALGMVHVVAELEIDVARLKRSDFFGGVQGSPDSSAFFPGPVRWTWYAAIEPRRPTGNTSSIEISDDDITTVTLEGHTTRIDRFGNADDSPSWGRDLRGQRASFYTRLLDLTPTVLPNRSSLQVEEAVADFRRSFPDLLEERPLSAMLAIREAEALASAGAADKAIDVLTTANVGLDWEDLTVRRAELEAIAGRFDVASQLLQEAGREPITPAGNFRAYRLQAALSVENRDEHGWSRDVARFAALGSGANQETSGKAAALAARAHLWWDETRPEDEGASGWGAFCPEGEVIAHLLRWRRGEASEEDLASIDRAVSVSPEARQLGAVARAAVLSSLNRGNEALALLTDVLPEMEARARTSFLRWQDHQLATAIHCSVLLHSGHRAEAMAAIPTIRRQLRPGLLPRILIDELLEQAAEMGTQEGADGQGH